MRDFKKYIPVVVFILLIVCGCEKYPDGPLINFESKYQRVDGLWDVEYFGINGYDSTAYLKTQPYYGLYQFSVQKEDGRMVVGYNAKYNSVYGRSGFWDFQDRKNNIYIDFEHYSGSRQTLGAYGATDVSWEIRRLMTEQLWIRTIYSDGREYYVKFKRMNV